QAEDGIRDRNVTGVQTCALPICAVAAAVVCAKARFMCGSAGLFVAAMGQLCVGATLPPAVCHAAVAAHVAIQRAVASTWCGPLVARFGYAGALCAVACHVGFFAFVGGAI